MSTKKYLIDTLSACEKHEFDNIVKTYLKEIYGYKRISITDSKNDTGIDLKIFDLEGVKNQFQLTVQQSRSQTERKSFESKLFDDVEKAKVNHQSYGFSNILYYFHSHPLTNKTIRDYEAKALALFGISLTIIESNRIADEAEEYLQLMNAIVQTNDIKQILNADKIFPPNEKNLVFDLVSFGKASDVRLHIIEAHILRQFHLLGQLTLDEIITFCHSKFKSQENNLFYEKLLNRLQTEKKIRKTEDKRGFVLSDAESKKISGLIGQNDLEEANFLKKLLEILLEFGQERYVEEYVVELKKVYVNNFNADIAEILSSATKELSAISRDFLNFLKLKGVQENRTKELAIRLFKVCKENNFIQKFCAAKVFSETTNISNIERYIHTRKRVFLDTQLILYSLCYFYNPNAEYLNYFYITTKTLLHFAKKNRIPLHVPSNYLWEAQNHLREALNLLPFTSLPNFDKLGKSKNVFYNYFLNEREQLQDENFSYSQFFERFGFRVYDRYTTHNRLIESYIGNLGIEVIDVKDRYYDIEESKRILISVLNTDNKFKSKFGLNNDAIILEYMADKDVDIHPLQPMLLSWDKTLFKSQKEYFRRNPTASRWFILTPSRFIDQYSLLQLSIDGDTVTNEILAFLSNDLIQGTHSLLDSITHILNPNDEVGLEYTNILARIRDNEIHRLKENSLTLPEDIEGEAVIDDVMYNLTSYYRESKDKFDAFKELFSDKTLINDVTSLIQESIADIYESKRFKEDILSKFDNLIARIRSN